jgi:translation initiation factor 1
MSRKPPAAPPAPGPFNPALAGLAGRLGPTPDRQPSPAAPPAPARAVVRLEKKGRGGKAVTVVEKLALRPAELAAWLAELKRSLGCGGTVEGGALVLQGDARERVGRLLEARGVRKVTVA